MISINKKYDFVISQIPWTTWDPEIQLVSLA